MDTDINRNLNNDEEVEIDLLELVFLFRRYWKVIVVVGLICAVLVGAFTYFFITPQYKATAKIYIVSASSDSVVNLTDLNIATNLTADYKELILSRPMMESTIKNLGLQETEPEDLAKRLDITNPTQTRILHVTATTSDPQLSADIANEVARLSISWLPEIMESNAPHIVQNAVVPTKKSSPSLKKNMAIGMLAGLVLCYGVYVIRYLLDDSITSADETLNFSDVAVLKDGLDIVFSLSILNEFTGGLVERYRYGIDDLTLEMLLLGVCIYRYE